MRRGGWNLGYPTAGVVLILAGLLLPGRVGSDGPVPLRIHYGSVGGDVLFPHAYHSALEQLGSQACAYCHHEMTSEDETLSCTRCHHAESFGLMEDEGLAEEHMGLADSGDPGVCMSCHDHGDVSAPLSRSPSASFCAECHEAEMLEIVQGHSCSACHAMAEEAEATSCAACHGGEELPSRADVLHDRCTRCHKDLEKTKFMDRSREDEASVCRTCHLSKR